ncbi:LysE family translocator [Profundibacter sp.]
MHDLVLILFGIAAVNVLAWLSPGPNTLAMISASISKGRRAGFATALGSSTGGMVWATLTVLGAATVFDLFPRAVFLLRMLGAAYLVWLGVKALRAAWRGQGQALEISQVDYSGWAAFRTGFFVIMTNPKAMLFFGSVFAAFIPENAPIWVLVVIVVFSQAQAFGMHCITVLVFSSKVVVQRFQLAQRRVNGVIGTLYCGLGLGVAADALRRI